MNNFFLKKIFISIVTLLSYFSSSSQLVTDSILIDNHYRKFHFKQPVSKEKNRSLIFILHGSGGDGLRIMEGASKLEEQAESENILLVYPDGYKKYWNECRKEASTPPNIENINENSFFDALIRYFNKNHSINTKHVFAVGTSGGGHMAYKLALTMPEKFKAITAIIANLPDAPNMDCTESKTPLSVMIINGTDDPVNPYGGGEVKSGTLRLGTVRSADETFTYWANLAGYSGAATKINLPDTDPTDGKTIEQYTYKTTNKCEVVLLKVIGGKHDYPKDINVYLSAWDFFKKQINSELK